MSRAVKLRDIPPAVRDQVRANRSTLPFRGPVHLWVPFDALVPDNAKYGARVIRAAGGRERAGLFLSAEYRAAKDRIEHMAREAMRDHGAPCLSPVRLDVAVWWPDRRRRDMLNYGKLLCDAIKGIMVADDSLIHEAVWRYRSISRTVAGMGVVVTQRSSWRSA